MAAKQSFLSLLFASSLLIRHGMSQSPGPDWPNCAAVPKRHYGGWEFYRLSHQPPMDQRPDALDATLHIDAQNDVDGSRTICFLSANATGASLNMALDSRSGGCETGWAKKYEAFTNQTQRAQTAVVTFDVATRELSINQTWTCRQEGQLLTFIGTARGIINMTCYNGREGERTSCGAVNLNSVLEPPVVLGPVTIVSSSVNPTPALPAVPTPMEEPYPPTSEPIPGLSEPLPPLPAPECRSLQRKWQVLSMSFTPPGPQPKSPSYWPTSLRAELRNLDDNSRTLCELGEEDVANYEQGILLKSDGEPLQVIPENGNRLHGCLTGKWHDKLPSARDPATQEWRWSEPANVTFNTKTHVLSINQAYGCVRSGVISVARAAVAQEVKMDCKESGNQYYPVVCEPTDAIYSNTSTPVVLGTPA